MTAAPPEQPRSSFAAPLVAWGALVVVALVVRPVIPVDETRYLSVAWEMWLRGDWLVPQLNGQPYPDKPPVLFWLMLLGWQVTGVTAWWPRLIAPILTLVNLALTATLARSLWPHRPGIRRRAQVFLLSGFLWATYSTFVLFDLPLTCLVQLGVLGALLARQGRPRVGWAITGACVGLGLLTKGPIVLLHILPLPLTAPWWAVDARPRSWARWYLGIAAAVAGGIALALVWAIPAAAAGGPEYGAAILWHQTADRMVNAFAHRRPAWWYLPVLPLALFPWILWAPLWSRLRALLAAPAESPVRACATWLGVVFLGLCLISGKQAHYLIPLLPAAALLAARATEDLGTAPRPRAWAAATAVVAFAAALVALSGGAFAHQLPLWASHAQAGWAAALLALAAAVLAARSAPAQMTLLATAAPVVVLVLHLAVVRPGRGDLDLAAPASVFRSAEDAGQPVAHVGRYAGQYHFLARLRRPFDVLESGQVSAWTEANPTGLVVCLRRRFGGDEPAFRFPYLDRWVTVYEATANAPCAPPAARPSAPAP